MVAQDDPDRAIRRVPGIEVRQESFDFYAAMTAFDPCSDVAVMKIQSRQNRAGAQAFVNHDRADFPHACQAPVAGPAMYSRWPANRVSRQPRP